MDSRVRTGWGTRRRGDPHYAVHIYDANNKRLQTTTRTVPPVPLSATERTWADSTIPESAANLPFGVPSATSPMPG